MDAEGEAFEDLVEEDYGEEGGVEGVAYNDEGEADYWGGEVSIVGLGGWEERNGSREKESAY